MLSSCIVLEQTNHANGSKKICMLFVNGYYFVAPTS